VRPAQDAAEVRAAMDLRVRVFCDEQGVDREAELDGLDDEATQVVAVDGQDVIATCRLRLIGRTCRLERMAVDRRYRGAGTGAELLDAAEKEARRQGAASILIHAQRRAEGFYAGAGYVAEGEPFIEEGIEHVAMTKAVGRSGW
jgi:predicted GNAT family N-acyltransferase